MTIRYLTAVAGGAMLLVACTKEPQPPSVADFLEDPIALEAAVVRCAQNRDRNRYEAECVNARQASSIIEAKEDRARAKAFEEQSERKREALRRTQEAAAEARRRAQEEVRQREEAEYLAQFGEVPVDNELPAAADVEAGNIPGMVVPEAADAATGAAPEVATNPAEPEEPAVASEDNNVPTDLNEIREELQRRGDGSVAPVGQ